jgi:hypothetical protein
VRRDLSLFRRAGAARLCGRVLLLAATLLACAPATASLAARAVAGGRETYASLIICFASGAPLPDAPGRPAPGKHRGIDCVLCETLCCGAAPPAGRPDIVDVAPIQTVNLPWMVADRAASTTLRLRSTNQARAPPVAG